MPVLPWQTIRDHVNNTIRTNTNNETTSANLNTAHIDTIDTTEATFLGTPLVFPTVADMVAYVGALDGQKASTRGYWAVGDGGANDYYFAAGASEPTNFGTVIDGDSGQWNAIDPSEMANVLKWGVRARNTAVAADNTARIKAALSLRLNIHLPSVDELDTPYYVDGTDEITIGVGQRVSGDSNLLTRLRPFPGQISGTALLKVSEFSVIENISMQGLDGGNSPGSAIKIVAGQNNWRIVRVNIVQFNDAIEVEQSNNGTIDTCYITTNTISAVSINGAVDALTIVNGVLGGSTYGLRVKQGASGNGLTVAGNTFDGAGSAQIQCEGFIDGLAIEDNKFVTVDPVKDIEQTVNGLIRDIQIIGNQFLRPVDTAISSIILENVDGGEIGPNYFQSPNVSAAPGNRDIVTMLFTAGVRNCYIYHSPFGNVNWQFCNIQDAGNNQYDLLEVPTVAALSTVVNAGVRQRAKTKGYYAAGDGAGNEYEWRAEDTDSIDGGWVLNGVDGRWHATDKSEAVAELFGSRGDDSTDNTNELNLCKAAAAGAGVPMIIRGGIHQTSGIGVASQTLEIRSSGATLKGLDSGRFVGGLIDLNSATGLLCEGIRFDTNKQAYPTITGPDFDSQFVCGIRALNGTTNIRVVNCEFVNLYTNHLLLNNANEIDILHCDFKSPQQLGNQTQCDFINYVTGVGKLSISNCNFVSESIASPAENCGGILIAGHTIGSVYIDNCLFNGVGRDNTGNHRVGVIDFYNNVDKINISKIVAEKCQHMFMRCNYASNVKVDKVYAECVNPELTVDVGFLNIGTNGTNSVKSLHFNNVTLRTADTTQTAGRAINVASLDWEAQIQDISFVDVTVENFYVGMELRGSIRNLTLEDFKTRNVRSNVISWLDQGVSGNEANGVVGPFKMRDMDIDNGADGVSVNLSGFSGTIADSFEVTRSDIDCAGSGVVINNANHKIEDNYIRNAARGIYPRGPITCVEGGNVYVGVTDRDFVEGGPTLHYSKPFHGTGTPEGTLAARPGAKYVDDANGDEYRKASGTGNTGWVTA